MWREYKRYLCKWMIDGWHKVWAEGPFSVLYVLFHGSIMHQLEGYSLSVVLFQGREILLQLPSLASGHYSLSLSVVLSSPVELGSHDVAPW